VNSRTPLLDRIKTPADLRRLEPSQLRQLADELRQETIDAVAVTGGHLGAGLPKVLSTAVSRRYEGTHRTPRSSSSPAIRRPAGSGPPPAAPVTSTSPLTRALLSVPGRLAGNTIINEVDTC